MYHRTSKLMIFVSIWVAAEFVPVPVGAEQVIRLIEYTNAWKFVDTGADLGTVWQDTGFDDMSWPSGNGLLGVESNSPPPYPVPVNTGLSLGDPRVITYYFRTRFQCDERIFAPGTILRADAFADDGCVIYLNGREAGRTRVPTNQNYQTLTGAPALGSTILFEGSNDAFEFDTNLLVIGENVVAVEVHQQATNSSDIMWGMRLTAVIPDPLMITVQPASIATKAIPSTDFGTPVSFRVGVSGGPVRYQWQRNGVAIPGAVEPSLWIEQPRASDVGVYSVILSNSLGAVMSEGANLTFATPSASRDPALVSAVVRIPSPQTNQIDLLFSKSLLMASATEKRNYVLTTSGDNEQVTISNAQANGPLVRLTVGGSNWVFGGQYYITVSNVRDINGNVIAPNTQVGVTWPFSTNLLSDDHIWSYHAMASADLSILDASWSDPAYVENDLWQSAQGWFDSRFVGLSNCVGKSRTLIPYQKPPTLFRTSFVRPPEMVNVQRARFKFTAGRALVVYLNGDEIYRTPNDLPARPAPLDMYTRLAPDTGGDGRCAFQPDSIPILPERLLPRRICRLPVPTRSLARGPMFPKWPILIRS